MANDNKKSERVILVHGTFAFDEFDDAPSSEDEAQERVGRWWQAGSEFSESLNDSDNLLAPVKRPYSVEEDLLGHDRPRDGFDATDQRVFHWSGENSETVRREAGKRLYSELKSVNDEIENKRREKCTCSDKTSCQCEGEKFHIVGHSHGGNVVWEALDIAAKEHKANREKKQRENRNESDVALPHLGRWVSVATPYLRFQWDWRPFVASLLIFVLVVMSFAGLPFIWFGMEWSPVYWFRDYWSRFDNVATVNWWTNFSNAFLFSLLTVLGLCGLGRGLWATYCFENGKASKSGDRRALDRYERQVAWLSFTAVVIITAIASFWALSFPTILDITFSWRGICGLVGFWLVLIVLGVTSIICIRSVIRWIIESARDKRRENVWREFGDRAAFIASDEDEAINALRVLQNRPQGPLLPRIPSPRSNRFSRCLIRAKSPERERARARQPRALTIVLLPIRMIYDWILRPLYNDVFAGLVDGFVLTRLWKQAYGCDLFGARPFKALNTPVSTDEVADWKNRFSISPPFNPTDVVDYVEPNLLAAIVNIRKQLGMNYTVGVNLFDFLKKAMAGDSVMEGALVHTSYFNTDQVRDHLRKTLKNEDESDPPKNGDDSTPESTDDCESPTPKMYEFISWLARGLVLLLLLLLPVALVDLTNWFVFYRYSGAYYLQEWAIDNKSQEYAIKWFSSEQASESDMAWGVYLTFRNQFDELPSDAFEPNNLDSDARERMKVRLAEIESILETPPRVTANKEGIEQFVQAWDEMAIESLSKNGSKWWSISTAVCDTDLKTIEREFEPAQRLQSIVDAKVNGITKSRISAKVLAHHALIMQRIPSFKRFTTTYLEKAEEFAAEARNSALHRRALENICKVYARMGNHDRALEIAATLDDSDRIKMAVHAFIFEINRPFRNDEENRLSAAISDEFLEELKKMP